MKYALIYQDKLKAIYEADSPKKFGGEWVDGESIEIPSNMNEERLIYENGFLSERPKSQKETKDEQEQQELEELKQYMKDLDIKNISNLDDVKQVLNKLAKAIVRIAK